MNIHTIDLKFFTPQTIAAYLVESDSELALIESGPDSVFNNLLSGIHDLGFDPRNIRKVLVTHVHLDHAGAAWHFGEMGATVFVHQNGARHLADPAKLLASAGKIYMNRMDELWGTMKAIPEARLHPTQDGEEIEVGNTKIRVLDTQGHASHHNSYLIEGSIFTGDVGGVRIKGGPVLPPTPAPDINVEVWLESIEKIRKARPAAIYPTHFGRSTDVERYLGELQDRLLRWTDWIGEKLRENKGDSAISSEFESYILADLKQSGTNPDLIEEYKNADPFWMNAPGLIRYWNKYRLQQ